MKLACKQRDVFSKILSDLKQDLSVKDNIGVRDIRRSLLLAGRTTPTFSATELGLPGTMYSRLTQRHLIKLCSYLISQVPTGRYTISNIFRPLLKYRTINAVNRINVISSGVQS
jgi:hypothetical protein